MHQHRTGSDPAEFNIGVFDLGARLGGHIHGFPVWPRLTRFGGGLRPAFSKHTCAGWRHDKNRASDNAH